MSAAKLDEFSVASLKLILFEQLRLEKHCSISMAFSGGMDSHVLLHALSRLAENTSFSLQAIHVNHSLHADSTAWANHCQQVCDELGIKLTIKSVLVSTGKGESIEAAARVARYDALAEALPDKGLCMTAQHMNDQSETLLLQLLRGAGVHGLASMPGDRKLANGRLLRPLLGFTRGDLLAYAQRHDLNWIEDPSNSDNRFDRNYLRNEVLPALRKRWPGMDKSISRSARHSATAAAMLDEMAAADLQHCQARANHFFPPGIASLRADLLRELPPVHQANTLRHWVRLNHLCVPGDERLHSFISLLHDSPRKGAIVWQEAAFRLHDDVLWLCNSSQLARPVNEILNWNITKPLQLPDQNQQLHSIELVGEGLAKSAIAGSVLKVCFRQGGEVCRMPGEHGCKSLKKLLQDLSVPAWQRSYLPLIYLQDELLAVSSLWCNPHYLAAPDEAGYVFSVQHKD